ncbi:MAG: Hsp20/alpha crystallin family protein [Candidatus Micrarchaeota archaeon]|nr:Hsp20/alpha crystallin family protein [Candidatus Micrarchaeota archaeon]MDE1847821.1 Hsp20/alpha crystallin family protein [Candidatus Micrarchaeota archaeon]MDE1864373.1 Hsp20/alpha crystallin family protein [Candidatus Micrarchaeota archaeon]
MAKTPNKDPFKVFNELFSNDESMRQLFRALVKDLANSLEEQRKGTSPLVYGINMTVKDGVPTVEQFGSLRSNTSREYEERAPLFEVITGGEKTVIIAEVPGAEKRDIELSCQDAKLRIVANAQVSGRSYIKEIALPEGTGARGAKAKYTNGILEITMLNGRPSKRSLPIKIE